MRRSGEEGARSGSGRYGRVDAGPYQASSWPPRRSAGASSALSGHRHRQGAARASQLWLQGFSEQARLLGMRALEEARPLQFALPVSVAMTWAGFNRYLSDTDIDAVEHDIVELMEHARTHSIGNQLGIGHCLLGLCQTRRNQFDTATPLVSRAVRGMIHYATAHTRRIQGYWILSGCRDSESAGHAIS